MSKVKKIAILCLLNILLLGIGNYYSREYPQIHILENTEVKQDFSLYSDIAYDVMEDAVSWDFIPENRYLDSLEVIFINLPEGSTGDLRLTIADGDKIVFEEYFDVSEVIPGEWQKFPVGKYLKAGRSYNISFIIQDSNVMPYIMNVGEDFDLPENGVGESGRKIVAVYSYGEDIQPFTIALFYLLLMLLDFVLVAKMFMPDNKKWTIFGYEFSIVQGIYLIALLGIFSALHIFGLSSAPYGINIDEMGMGYDAWSLSEFGHDRWLNPWPVYLVNFQNGQSVLYAYICMVFVKVFGLSTVTMRIPGVIVSYIALIYGSKLIALKWKNNTRVLLLFITLYTILPYFIMSARFGFDCNLSMGIAVVFLYYFVKMLQTGRKGDYVKAGVVGGILLYSYALTWIALPCFLAVSVVLLLIARKISFKELCLFGVPLFVLAIPLLIFNVINIFDLPSIRIAGVSIVNIPTYRSDFLSKNVFEQLNSIYSFLFLESGEVYPQIKPLFWISIPFCMVGAWNVYTKTVESLKNKEYSVEMAMAIWCVSWVLVGLFIPVPETYRLNGIYFSLLWFVLEGIIFLFDKAWAGKKFLLTITGVIYVIQFLMFVDSYYYSKEYYRFFYSPLDEVVAYIDEELPDGMSDRQTYLYTNDGWTSYVYYLAAKEITPIEFAEAGQSRYECRNWYFDIKGELDASALYVVDGRYYDKLLELRDGGFNLVKLENYWIGWQ